ncbi:formate--tetrahydrofolate ligase [bacterium]|nr:formate--tetrahydrofolate ligase [bacterium]
METATTTSTSTTSSSPTQPSDIDLANNAKLRPITEVAADLGLGADDIELYGKYKAKIAYEAIERILSDKSKVRGKLILVSAITPTKAGEGKTTTSVGLAQALRKRGKGRGLKGGFKVSVALREPSMGPVFGQKGGGTGGGYSQLMPMDDINLHFNGDLHAIGAANNLLAALIDNHIHFGNALGIDQRAISFRRAMDMNDRSLRNLVQGLGGKANGIVRETGFDITAASEVMATLCLADSMANLRERLGNIVVAKSTAAAPITAKQVDAAAAMAIILKDAIKPNLVQTLDGTPAFVHGGPFANIAHGTSSVLSGLLALYTSDYVVTEAGFGADLGLEKFCDIVANLRTELAPDAVVLVATVKALKLHGGVAESDLSKHDLPAIERGLCNLERHVANVQKFGVPAIVCVNKFAGDSEEELTHLLALCKAKGIDAITADVWAKGADGALDLADLVMAQTAKPSKFAPLYKLDAPIKEKLATVASTIYGAASVEYSNEALKELKWLDKNGYGNLPVCVAKTQYSFSDDPSLLGAPSGFKLNIRQLRLSAGAGFVVAITGEIMTMPGLPKKPASVVMELRDDGKIARFY